MIKNSLVSIVTVSFNGASVITDCLHSVAMQDYPDIEHLVIDGKSTDGTVKALESNPPRGGFFISERDKGIYDAMNKGVQRSRGDIIAILNCDNFYPEPCIVRQMVAAMNAEGADLAYGDAEIVDFTDTQRVRRVWRSGPFSEHSYRLGWMPPHQTVFIRREIYERFGLYDLNFSIASDYELLLRLLLRHRVKWCYVPKVVVRARDGGVSNASLANVIHSNLEVFRAWSQNGLRPPWFLPILKPARKIAQLRPFSKRDVQ